MSTTVFIYNNSDAAFIVLYGVILLFTRFSKLLILCLFLDSGESDPLLGDVKIDTPYNSLQEFWDAVNPICKEEWIDKKWYGKFYLVVKVLLI